MGTGMSMLSMNIILVSLVSLVTAQPMSLTEPSQPLLSCNFLSCAGSIQGECKDCICDIIPHLCQEKMIVPAKYQEISHSQENTEAETDSQLSCNFLACTSSILGAVNTCLNTGSPQEVIECVRNILDSIGQGDCKDCICDIIPNLC